MKYKFIKLDDMGGPHVMVCETRDGKVVRTCPLLVQHIGNDIRFVLLSAQHLGYTAHVEDHGDVLRQLPNITKSYIEQALTRGVLP
jgi:hypothetical protein